jgi:hypothetical protein
MSAARILSVTVFTSSSLLRFALAIGLLLPATSLAVEPDPEPIHPEAEVQSAAEVSKTLSERTSDTDLRIQMTGPSAAATNLYDPEMLPTARLIAEHDARSLAVCPSLLIAPPIIQLAFPSVIDLPIDEHGNRMLHIASRSGNLFALWQLLELGADTSVRNRFGKTPADVAFRRNSLVQQNVITALKSGHRTLSDVHFKRPGSISAAKPTQSRILDSDS